MMESLFRMIFMIDDKEKACRARFRLFEWYLQKRLFYCMIKRIIVHLHRR